MKLVNIGCGNIYHKDWINIDYTAYSKEVIQHDLSKGIPLKSQTVDFLYNSHILEHFNKKDGHNLLLECKRVLKKGGILRIVVPDLKCLAEEYLNAFNSIKELHTEYSEANYNWSVIELIDQLVRDESGGEMLKYWAQEKIINPDVLERRIGSGFVNFKNFSIPSKKFPITLKERIKNKILNYFGVSWDDYLKICFYKLGERHKWMYDEVSLKLLLKSLGFDNIKVQNGETSYFLEWKNYSSLDVENDVLRKPDSLIIEAINPNS